MDNRYNFLILGLLIILISSGVAEVSAQPEGDSAWLPITSWSWSSPQYEVSIIGGGTSFLAYITFENRKAETATITSLTMATPWTPQPTWNGRRAIAPGTQSSIEFNGQIPAGQVGNHVLSMTGIVEFDGTEYKMTWMEGATLIVTQGIPGFPIESITLGLLAAMVVLLAKRGIRLPTARFQ